MISQEEMKEIADKISNTFIIAQEPTILFKVFNEETLANNYLVYFPKDKEFMILEDSVENLGNLNLEGIKNVQPLVILPLEEGLRDEVDFTKDLALPNEIKDELALCSLVTSTWVNHINGLEMTFSEYEKTHFDYIINMITTTDEEDRTFGISRNDTLMGETFHSLTYDKPNSSIIYSKRVLETDVVETEKFKISKGSLYSFTSVAIKWNEVVKS